MLSARTPAIDRHASPHPLMTPRRGSPPKPAARASRLRTLVSSARTVACRYIAPRGIGWMISRRIWKCATQSGKSMRMTMTCGLAGTSRSLTTQACRRMSRW
ncbi:hypothetical protein EMPG_17780 [Blastomyces silverae]|uniref:Uncharacterized protein n=1 Tax=Blastomyces silverae TaxID=2060906 RepID=A0A0H1BBV3_9EURO|nr:hypothetical protein EMPG_17780 [Blastomyces silverae]